MNRNLHYIYAVYKAGSLSAAARELYISQPSLSATIKKVEENLGVPIFNRKTKPLSLTEYGTQYIAYLEKIQDLEREFDRYLNDVRGLHTGTLWIGANNVFASFVLPALICEFKSLYPGIQVQMVEGNISYLENALLSGNLDFVLDNCPMDTDTCVQHCFGTEHLLLAAHRSVYNPTQFQTPCLSHQDILCGKHLNTNTPSLSIEAFSDLPFIALRNGNDTRLRMNTIFQEANLKANIQLEVDQLATAYNISCTGLGLTLVSDTLLYKVPLHPDMHYYKLDSASTTRKMYLYHKRSHYLTMAMQKFMDSVFSERFDTASIV